MVRAAISAVQLSRATDQLIAAQGVYAAQQVDAISTTVSSQGTAIADQGTAITDLQTLTTGLDVTAINTELADHETRLTAGGL